MTIRDLSRRVLYGVGFCIVLPVLLYLWAHHTANVLEVPHLSDPVVGILLAGTGAALMLWGMAALAVKGGGLPMNAYPPPKFVATGIYSAIGHPIYLGFVLVCFGAAVATGSVSGLWLVTPAVALGSAAIVLGYEQPDLRRRFGRVAWPQTLLPPADDAPPAQATSKRFLLIVVLPWLAFYYVIESLGAQPGAVDLQFPFERTLPVLQQTELLYASVYLIVVISPFLARTNRDLRLLSLRAWAAMLVIFPLFILFPVVPPERVLIPTTTAGHLLEWERATNAPTAQFPAFHVVWAVIAAAACATSTRRARWMWRLWAIAASISCVTTGMHAIADVMAGFVVAIAILHAGRIWRVLRAATERLANSWREWHIGPVRIINHGVYAGAGTVVAYLIVGAVAGPGKEAAVAYTAVGALIGAALWAQWIEGSPRLLRPYGFYGGVTGVILASLVVGPALGVSIWTLLAAHCLAAPWLQSLGRLRCLVQGCCHGAPTSPEIGIRYDHPRSRVTRIAGLAGVPLHATPLYSILWNMPVALVLIRLWSLHAPLHVVAGVYLILSGIGRFVEEAYRGEPQTPIYARLRLYQWVGMITVVAGAVITAVARSDPAPSLQFTWPIAANAVLLGLIATAALGVDVPAGSRRFARLT